MNEVKSTLRRMAVYYLLLLVNILPNSVIADVFPVRNLSTIYLLALSVCLVLYYVHRVSPTGGPARAMKSLSVMALVMILLRGVKYGAVAGVGVLARHAWYAYYVPILLLPLLLLYIALSVAPRKRARVAPLWYVALGLTVVMIALVLTNDLHQQAFAFQEGFVGWDNDYTHGWLFYLVTVWQYALYLVAIVVLVVKCRISQARKTAWIILIPVAIGAVLSILLLTGTMPKINGAQLLEFPEVHIFTAAVVLECCMQLGLIPTNTDYGKLFRRLSLNAQIADAKGTIVYSSASAVPLTHEQFALESGARIGEHTVLNKMEIPGGYGFWQDDMTKLDSLNEELEEAKEGLEQEAELIRLRNELKEKQTKIEQRTLVYDNIARRVQKQSQAISLLAQEAQASQDPALREAHRRKITLLGAYIKRYANLMLLAEESAIMQAGELGLAVSEVLRYLNYCGIPGEVISRADCTLPAEAALRAFEAFETLIESNYAEMKGVFVRLSSQEEVEFKLVVEDLTAWLPAEWQDKLAEAGIKVQQIVEDDVAYIGFVMPKGGEAL